MSGMAMLDKQAQQAGFPDYATMQAYLSRQQAGIHQNNGAVYAKAVPQQAGPAVPAQQDHPAQQGTVNWLGRLMQALSVK